MVWSAVGQLAGVQVLRAHRQFARSTLGDVAAVHEELQADFPGINAFGLMSWFARDFDAATQGLDLVPTVPVGSRPGPLKRVP